MPFKDYRNIHHMLKETVDSYPDAAAFRWFAEPDRLESIDWTRFYETVKRVSKSLMALGVQKGDKVNILSYTCYKWVLTDLGINALGACTVGIYQSNLSPDCEYIINHCEAVVIFVEDDEQLKKIQQIRKEIPNIRQTIMLNGECPDDELVISFEQFLELGGEINDEAFMERVEAVTADDPATIVYTSGTTARPKGAVLTHDNVTFTTQSARQSTDIHTGDEHFIFLPLAHIFARLAVYFSLLSGVPTTFARGMDTIIDDIKVAQPHWFISVPRIYEKVYSKVVSGAEAKGGLALKIFSWARSVGNTVSDCRMNKQPVPFLTGLKYQLATKLVFSKIHQALGGRVRWCISGAAPLNPDINRFFHAAGILILEGIGMTENMSFTNVSRVDNYRFGWVGPPGPGIEQKTAPDGEVMYKGRNVMQAYFKMPEETTATLTADGWLNTGDIGEIDAENFLRITGRKKELIITSGGKNIAPAPIEGFMATSKYINQICVVGDKRKFLTAIVTVDPDNIVAYAEENGISHNGVADLIKNERILQLIQDEIEEKNRELPSYETIKKVSLVPEFTIDNGLITPTMKLKKGVIIAKYQEHIDRLYPAD